MFKLHSGEYESSILAAELHVVHVVNTFWTSLFDSHGIDVAPSMLAVLMAPPASILCSVQ